MEIENVKYRKHRFSEKFYREIYHFVGYDINMLPIATKLINEKLEELCGLVCPEGAWEIVKQEQKIGFMFK